MKIRHIIAIASIIILTILFASPPGFAGQTYKVLKGDTLFRIGKMFNTTPEALKELNNLKNDKLSIGQVLKVKADQPESVAPPEKTAGNSDNRISPQTQPSRQAGTETQTYTVRNGDTLYGIARSFNISLKALTAANTISNSNNLKIGQILTIPGENKSASVASAANKISGNSKLKIGQVLTIPDENKSDGETSAPAAAVMRLANLTNLKSETANEREELTVRDRLVEAGFNMLGVRYRFGGTSEKTGFDCSGLVKNLFEKFNLTLPRSSRDQYKQGEKVAKEDLQKGDLLFFSAGGKTPTHVGIYIGDNQFLHAASKAKKVVISDLGKNWYDLRYLGARRIMELWWGDFKTPTDNSSFEWTHHLLDTSEDAQIPLNDVMPEEFTVPLQKYDGVYEEIAAHIIPD